MFIAQGTTATITFLPTDTTNPQLGVNGADPFTIAVSVNGGPFTVTSQTLPNPLAGWYTVTLGPPLTNTLGQVALQATATDPNTPGETLVWTQNNIQIVPPTVLNPATPTGATIAIQRGVALPAMPFPMYSNAAPPVLLTGLSVAGQRSLDGGAFVTLAGPIHEIGAGWYATPLTASETNGQVIALRFSAAGAQDQLITIPTQPT